MNAREMQLSFEMKIGQFANYDFPVSFQSHEIDDYLNEAQDTVTKNLHAEFEKTEMVRTELGPLIRNILISTFATGSDRHTNGFIANCPTGMMFPIQERCNVVYTDCNSNTGAKEVKVIPVTHDEYALNIDNPYTKPYTDLVWRMDHGSTGAYHKRHELITDGVVSLTSYSLRYIKRPLVIDIVAKNTCELDPLAHDDVVDLAVQIAIKAKSLVQNVQPKQ